MVKNTAGNGDGVAVGEGVSVGVIVGDGVTVGVSVGVEVKVAVNVGVIVGPNNWPGPQLEINSDIEINGMNF